ncbi:CotH kinase family protein [candidate division KSB1 bacterium]|nr:CotH kinase family protein [candidate division KSB1 bacterium]
MKLDFVLLLTVFFFAAAVDAQDKMTLVPQDALKRVLVPKSYVSANWRLSSSFNESGWRNCAGAPGGVGYEKDSGYEHLISLDVGADMHADGDDPNSSCYIRIKFTLVASVLSKIKMLQLNVRADDGFITYLNGTKIAEQNAPANPQWNSTATAIQEAGEPVIHDVSPFIDQLVVGENLLAIHGLNESTASSDFLITAELVGATAGGDAFDSSNLPLVFVNTFGQTIPNDVRIVAEMGIIDNGPGHNNSPMDPFNDYHGRISIEVRGSTSVGFPKQQYSVETQDSLGENLNVELMGLPPENDWILHAPYSDKSLMRNVLIYRLARDLGWYATRTKYCELFLNGDYRGVYVLMEKIKRDKNRVDIATLTPDLAGDPLTGGYIFKIDKEPWKPGWESHYPPFPHSNKVIKYQYHYPEADDMMPAQRDYIKGFMDEFEDVMAGDLFADPTSGFAKYIDVPSFVDFFILNEIAKNVDGYRLSTFMYKDRDDNGGKLTLGPIWDFNLGFGNADYKDGWNTETFIVDFLTTDIGHMIGDTWQVPFYWQRLLSTPEFTKRIYKRWVDLRKDKLSTQRIFAIMDSLYSHIEAARIRNFERWEVLGQYIWPNAFVGQTYDEEFDWMKNWINARLMWMDGAIDAYRSDVDWDGTPVTLTSPALRRNYPNPFNATTCIEFDLPLSAHVRLQVYNMHGRLVRTLIDAVRAPGRHTTIWEGDDDVADALASGIYFYRLFVGGEHDMILERKMLLLK